MGHNTWTIRTCLSSLIFWTLLCKLKGEQSEYLHISISSYLQAKQVQDHQHEHSNCKMDKPHDKGSFPGQGTYFPKHDRWVSPIKPLLSQVFCSDILDAITKDFFARKQHTPDETMHVEDIQVLENDNTIKSDSFLAFKCTGSTKR